MFCFALFCVLCFVVFCFVVVVFVAAPVSLLLCYWEGVPAPYLLYSFVVVYVYATDLLVLSYLLVLVRATRSWKENFTTPISSTYFLPTTCNPSSFSTL